MSGEVSSLTERESIAECQRYLTSFRVLELKELLKSVNCSQKGKKHELFQRANELLRHGSPKIQKKIIEINSRSGLYRKAPLSKTSSTVTYSSPLPVKQPVASKEYIVHPDVVFKPHPFFQRIDSIIRPTALVSTALASQGNLSMRLHFHLTPKQIEHIYLSKYAKTSTGSYVVQVLFRFCRQETSCEQSDFYPKQCYLKINGQYCPLPNYHPQSSLREDYKRTGTPVNITNYVKTSPTQANDITIYWTHDIIYPQGFCVCVEQAKSLSASDLLQSLKNKGIRSSDISRALVKEKLSADRDSEISATSLRVSLLCPLGKMRLQHPCRSTSCTHIQCFDASVYVQMNERKARWICPVCDKEASVTDLVIDGLFMEICEKATSNDIEFHRDGSWHEIDDKAKGTPLCPDKREERYPSPVTITDTPEIAEVEEGSGQRWGQGSSNANPILIDLTSSSDEESEGEVESAGPPAKRICIRQRRLLSFQSSVGTDLPESPPTSDDDSSGSGAANLGSSPASCLSDSSVSTAGSRQQRCSSRTSDSAPSSSTSFLPQMHTTPSWPLPVITSAANRPRPYTAYPPQSPHFSHPHFSHPPYSPHSRSSTRSSSPEALSHLSRHNYDTDLPPVLTENDPYSLCCSSNDSFRIFEEFLDSTSATDSGQIILD